MSYWRQAHRADVGHLCVVTGGHGCLSDIVRVLQHQRVHMIKCMRLLWSSPLLADSNAGPGLCLLSPAKSRHPSKLWSWPSSKGPGCNAHPQHSQSLRIDATPLADELWEPSSQGADRVLP